MRNSKFLLLALLLAGMLAVPTSWAAEKKGGKDQAMRRLQLMQMKLNEEKAALEREKSALTQQVAELARQVEELKASGERKRAALEKNVEALKTDSQSLQGKLGEEQNRRAELEKQHKETLTVLDGSRQEADKLRGELKRTGQALGSCEAKNTRLYDLNRELLGKYRDKGLFEALLQAEPLTGIRAVEMENAVDEYRDKLSAQRVEEMR